MLNRRFFFTGSSGLPGNGGPEGPHYTWVKNSAAAFALRPELAVEHRRRAEASLRHQGVAGDHTHTRPAQSLVKAFGVAAGDGVEHQQRLAAVARRGFSLSH